MQQEADAEQLLLDERAKNVKLEEQLYQTHLLMHRLGKARRKGKILVNTQHLLNDVQFMHHNNEKLAYLEYDEDHYIKLESVDVLTQPRPAKIIDHSKDVY